MKTTLTKHYKAILKQARKGNVLAQTAIARACIFNNHEDISKEEVYEFLLEAVINDPSGEADWLIAHCYLYGFGTEKDKELATSHLLSAESKGHTEALCYVGMFDYLEDQHSATAPELVRKAAKRNNTTAVLFMKLQEIVIGNLLETLDAYKDKYEDIAEDNDSGDSSFSKPCKKLDYCPYGILVEGFPVNVSNNDIACERYGHDCPAFHVCSGFAE